MGYKSKAIKITVNGAVISDGDVAEMMVKEFTKNLSPCIVSTQSIYMTSASPCQLQLNSTEAIVAEAICSCPNSNACPDGVSHRLLKVVCKYDVRPLNIIFQQSLFTGSFLTIWKHAIVILLYKGKGDASHPSSYRPISLCSCLEIRS